MGVPLSRNVYWAFPVEQAWMRSAEIVSADWRADHPVKRKLLCRDSVGKYIVTAREVGDKGYHLNIRINSPDSNEKTSNCPILQH